MEKNISGIDGQMGFDFGGNEPIVKDDKQNLLDITFSEFLGSKRMPVEELFAGYDTMLATTYSYGLGFIEKILETYAHAKIVLGYDRIVSRQAAELQLARNGIIDASNVDVVGAITSLDDTVRTIKGHSKLIERAFAGEVEFMMLRQDMTSHQKFYILTGEGGKSRVIVASANFSKQAFSGKNVQMENYIIYDDDTEALNYYMGEFEFLCDSCATPVAHKVLAMPLTEHPAPEELPGIGDAIERNVGFIVEATADDEEVEYTLDAGRLAPLVEKALPKSAVTLKEGLAIIIPTKLKTLVRNIEKAEKEEVEKRKEHPSLSVDLTTGKAEFCGQPLVGDNGNVKADLLAIKEYFAGIGDFIGDTVGTERAYWKSLCLMFLSPYIANLRKMGVHTGYGVEPFPYWLLICGNKSAGKTSFVRFGQILMSAGREIKDNVEPKIDYIRAALKVNEGFPSLVDEAPPKFASDEARLIKNDREFSVPDFAKHGTIIATANSISSIEPPIAKRMAFIRVEATQENGSRTVSKNRVFNDLCARITGGFYAEWLRRTAPKVGEMIMKMERHGDGDAGWMPDIFELSSQTVLDIFSEYDIDLPTCMTPLCYDDYFSDAAIGEEVKKQILDIMKNAPKSIAADKRAGTLTLTLAGEGSSKLAKDLLNQLPSILETKIYSNRESSRVVMKLAEAEAFLGTSAKKQRKLLKHKRNNMT